MKMQRAAVGFTGIVVLAGSIVAVAPGGQPSPGQRIAIQGQFNTATGKSTWKLVPLTKGALAKDSGRGVGTGSAKPGGILATGQRVITISGGDALTGKRGSIQLKEDVTSHNAGHGYTADIGRWSFTGKTGEYSGYSGGGGFAATLLPSGVLMFRMEGYVAR